MSEIRAAGRRLTAGLAAALVVATGLTAVMSSPAFAVSRAAIVSAAQSELDNGTRNHESPMGSGCNYYTGFFRPWKPSAGCPSSGGVQWRDSDWCADFAKYVWRKAGVKHADVPEGSGGVLDGWAASFKNYGVAYGTWHTRGSGYTPQPGDAVVFDWDQSGDIDHVGIVKSATSSTVHTIEGNSGDRVQSNSYSRTNPDIVGYSAPVNGSSTPEPPQEGRDSTGYYNPADGTFHLRDSLDDGASNHAWDTNLETIPGAVVLTGDWNGDGSDSTGYYNPADGTFHLRNPLGEGTSSYGWDTGLESMPGAVIVTGDWNGDGKDSTGYYNPSDGTFHLRDNLDAGGSNHAWDTDLETIPGAVILTGDWNGDGKDSLGYFNPADGTYHLRDTLDAGGSNHAWDTALETDVPGAVIVTGDWNGDGKDSVGYYDRRDGTFHLRDALGDGASDYAWGTALETLPAAVILTGDWNGA
ncbi:CHAP domain-containing protein [Sphaerisporangium aureirubrum]|uniref:CHAP domain-containing protein n=1 Tax=Sphaerisporangium aureirubrum TaxID=1544736 RepID=A0ABW1NPR4_9ACTN